MNRTDSERWKSDVLDEVFAALAADSELASCLVFKGARVLNVHLGGGRQSLDLDSNLAQHWTILHPDRTEQREWLKDAIGIAVARHFARQPLVRYELTAASVSTHPPRVHPQGWDAFIVNLKISDLSKQVRGLPAIEIDVAAPEELLSTSLTTIEVGGRRATVYSLERIAGEKLRAFLSSLPEYRAKVRKPGDAVRAKDLYDLVRIRRHRELDDTAFWHLVGEEFRLACRSRFIDCAGLNTLRQQWDVTRQTYAEATIPKDIPFADAESNLTEIVGLLENAGFLPFTFPLPALPEN